MLRASFQRVESRRRPDAISLQSYPVRSDASADPVVQPPSCSITNVPILDALGAVTHIVHHADHGPALLTGTPARQEIRVAAAEDDASLSVRDIQFDLARLAKSERLMRMAASVALFGGWSYDVATETLTWSDEVYRIHEAPPGYTPTVATGIESYAPEFRAALEAAFRACVQDGRPFDLELQIVTLRGNRRWVRAIGEAVRGQAGQVIRVDGAFQDIERQVTDRTAAAQSAAALSATLESISDAFFTLDAEWRFTYVNRQAEMLLQRPRGELIGQVVWTEFPDAVGSQFERQYRRVVGEREDVTFEEFFPPLGRWFDVRAYPAADGGIAVYFRDATARLAQDEQLRVLRASIERLNDIVLITNAEPLASAGPQIAFVNEAFERITGFTRDDVAAHVPRLLFGVGTDRQDVERIRRALEQREPIRAELRNVARDGREIWLELDLAPVADESGRCTHWVAVARDITARRRVDARVREHAELLERTQDAVLVRDLSHRVTYWNRAAEEIYGYSRDEALGQSVADLIYTDQSAFNAAFSELLEQGQWSGELVKRRKNGATVLVAARWTLLRDEHGEPMSVLVTSTNITERKRIEQQYLRAQRLESLGTLAGGIAHDLNNVLAPILMSIDLLRLKASDPSTVETLKLISESAQRGANMVSQVLSFARGVEGTRIQVDPRHIVRDVSKIAIDTFPKNIQITQQLAQELWLVEADATQLHQVLLNLCVNARDAMPGGGSLSISAENVLLDAQYAAMNIEAREGPHVRIDVADSGTGIPAAIIDKIFDPFFTTKEVGKGTGLGLSTTLAIVKSHGGFIRAYSDVGVGTRMRVYLPAMTAATAASNQDMTAALPRGNGETVMVVDDEASIRQITRQTLEAFGYSVILAADGSEAVSIFAKRGHEVALVITDLMMPIMDGVATIQVLRRLDPSVRVIAASGITANGNVARASDAGVRHFLPKPYTADTLLKIVRQVLDM